jgi:hypothetical protein
MQMHAVASDAKCNNIIQYNRGQQSSDNVVLRKMVWLGLLFISTWWFRGTVRNANTGIEKRHVIIIRNNNYGAGRG